MTLESTIELFQLENGGAGSGRHPYATATTMDVLSHHGFDKVGNTPSGLSVYRNASGDKVATNAKTGAWLHKEKSSGYKKMGSGIRHLDSHLARSYDNEKYSDYVNELNRMKPSTVYGGKIGNPPLRGSSVKELDMLLYIIDAGGEGSGWTTENGHISHASLTPAGFQFHHTGTSGTYYISKSPSGKMVGLKLKSAPAGSWKVGEFKNGKIIGKVTRGKTGEELTNFLSIVQNKVASAPMVNTTPKETGQSEEKTQSSGQLDRTNISRVNDLAKSYSSMPTSLAIKQIAEKIGMNGEDIYNKVKTAMHSWGSSSLSSAGMWIRNEAPKITGNKENVDAGLSILHAVTQAKLQQLYPKGNEVTLYRGVGQTMSSNVPDAYKAQIAALQYIKNSAIEDGSLSIKSLGADSWTTDKGKAKQFSNPQGGLVISNKVPFNDVLASYDTSPELFHHDEHEYIVAYPDKKIPVSVSSLRAAKAQINFKLVAAMNVLRKYGWGVEVNGKDITLTAPEDMKVIRKNKLEAGGPGSGRHPYGQGIKNVPLGKSRKSAPSSNNTTISKKGQVVDVAKSTAAKSSAVLVAADVQRKADGMEAVVAGAVKGKSYHDSEAMDVTVMGKNGRLQGIEVKTIMVKTSAARLASGRAERIYMGHGADARKLAWAKANKADMHTVVVDIRNGGLTVYHGTKVGSLSFGRPNSPLQPVPGNFRGLKKLIVG